MRVLLASTSGAGHFGPLVPFAHALRRAGHEILVAAPISAQSRVERAGLPSICFADPLERDVAPVWEHVRAATPDEANRLVLGELFGRVRARAALPGVELAIDAWRPDVVVRESCEFASAVAAEARDIPVARVGAFLQTVEDYTIRTAAPAVDELRQWVGLPSDPTGDAPHRLALPDAHARLVRAAGWPGAAARRGASTTRRRRCGRCGRRARGRSST